MLNRPVLTRVVIAAAALVIDLLLWGGDGSTRLGGVLPDWLVIAVAAAGYACLAVPRTPLLGFAALWLISLGGLLVPAFESFAGYLIALFTMARWMPTAPALMALGGSAVPIAINTLNGTTFVDDAGTTFLVVTGVLWTLLFTATWLVGRALARSARRLTTQRQWAEESRAEAVSAERLRISRELHDIVAHSLTAIVLQAAGARSVHAKKPGAEGELDTALEAIQTTGAQSMRELHRLLGLLRQTGSDDIDEQQRLHGIADIAKLVEDTRATGLSVNTFVTGEPVEADPSIAHTAYRVVQEGLSNAMKYAGIGARVEVAQSWSDDSLTITVRNWTGAGSSNAISGGFGLVGLRERVTVSGGSLEAQPTADGFVLQARLPITPHDTH